MSQFRQDLTFATASLKHVVSQVQLCPETEVGRNFVYCRSLSKYHSKHHDNNPCAIFSSTSSLASSAIVFTSWFWGMARELPHTLLNPSYDHHQHRWPFTQACHASDYQCVFMDTPVLKLNHCVAASAISRRPSSCAGSPWVPIDIPTSLLECSDCHGIPEASSTLVARLRVNVAYDLMMCITVSRATQVAQPGGSFHQQRARSATKLLCMSRSYRDVLSYCIMIV